VATPAIRGAIPPYPIENVCPLAVPYQGIKVKRSHSPFE
jgi:hypothetical protein